MKTKIICATLILLFTVAVKSQNSFGEHNYMHPDTSILTTGIVTLNSPGFLLAGIKPVGTSVTFNFTIDRPSQGGLYNGNPNEFRKEYKVYADLTLACNITLTTQISSRCRGVSVIESKVAAIQSEYALVASFDEGLVFSFLDYWGSPITANTYFFPFPSNASVTKPLIVEDPNAPGYFFIVGVTTTQCLL